MRYKLFDPMEGEHKVWALTNDYLVAYDFCCLYGLNAGVIDAETGNVLFRSVDGFGKGRDDKKEFDRAMNGWSKKRRSP